MKRWIGVLAGMCMVAGLAVAGSPSQTTGTVATAGTSFAVPASGSMAYKLQAVVFGATAGTTQTVSLVHGSITNQIGTKAVSATDRMLWVTNAPWTFPGERVLIATTATNAFGVVLVGETGD